MSQSHTLPDLPYDYAALEPVISAEIMELHHKKHHNAYVTNLNKALESLEAAEAKGDMTEQIKLQSAVKFNGGGHLNHSIFWTNLTPGGSELSGDLKTEIEEKWGSLDALITEFNAKAAAIQGSGWQWLAYSKEKKRPILVSMPNQDPVGMLGFVPLLGIDVWEHAYYLQYKNVRPDYLKAIWQIVNWDNVSKRYKDAIK